MLQIMMNCLPVFLAICFVFKLYIYLRYNYLRMMRKLNFLLTLVFVPFFLFAQKVFVPSSLAGDSTQWKAGIAQTRQQTACCVEY